MQKKYLLLLVCLLMAGVGFGATSAWKSGILYKVVDETGTQSTTEKLTSGQVTGYLYTLADQSAMDAAKAMTTAQLYNEYVVGGKATTATTTTIMMNNMILTMDNLPSGSESNPQHAYGLVIYVDTVDSTADTKYVKSYVGEATWQDGTGQDVTSIASKCPNKNNPSWTPVSSSPSPVPEPTSGLLVLMGMAGLMLRRRHA